MPDTSSRDDTAVTARLVRTAGRYGGGEPWMAPGPVTWVTRANGRTDMSVPAGLPRAGPAGCRDLQRPAPATVAPCAGQAVNSTFDDAVRPGGREKLRRAGTGPQMVWDPCPNSG